MPDTVASSEARQHAFWLASRGAQQMDLAGRFSAAARSREVRVLALKGISMVDELYGGAQNRPMADVDLLVVDAGRFVLAAEVARSLGLVETGASDHALVFKEPASGVVLELHLSLTACPGLFTVDHEAAWARRAPVRGTSMFRLCDEDLVVHLALHTAFQHAFVAGEYHYRDFAHALDTFRPPADLVIFRAREWSALAPLGAMAFACRPDALGSPDRRALLDRFEPYCPKAVRRFIEAQPRMPPPMSLWSFARIRFELAPSKWGYVRQTLLPGPIPARTLPRLGAMRRLAGLIDASLFSPAPPRP